SRKNYKLASHALPSAAAEAGFLLGQHHNALADAKAAAAIVVDISARWATPNLDATLQASRMQRRIAAAPGAGTQLSHPIRQALTLHGISDASKATVSAGQLPDRMHWPNEGPNPPVTKSAVAKHPLHGQHVVFTGMLGIPRHDAKNKA